MAKKTRKTTRKRTRKASAPRAHAYRLTFDVIAESEELAHEAVIERCNMAGEADKIEEFGDGFPTDGSIVVTKAAQNDDGIVEISESEYRALQDVLSTVQLDYALVDYDTDGAIDEAPRFAYTSQSDVLPDRVNELFNVINPPDDPGTHKTDAPAPLHTRLQDVFDSIQDGAYSEALSDLKLICAEIGHPIHDETEDESKWQS